MDPFDPSHLHKRIAGKTAGALSTHQLLGEDTTIDATQKQPPKGESLDATPMPARRVQAEIPAPSRPQPQPAFHSSPAEGIHHFKPMSHFGSRSAASDRAQRFSREGTPWSLYEVDLSIDRPLRIHDLPKNDSRNSLHSALKLADFLYYDTKPKVLTSTERDSIIKAYELPPRADGTPEPDALLIEILEAKGFNGIVYENQWEDRGSDSWIIFHPDQVVIKSASCYPHLENQHAR